MKYENFTSKHGSKHITQKEYPNAFHRLKKE